LIIAAKAIPNNLDAKALLPFSRDIIVGLINQNINVISYACDGTDVERSVQRLLVSSGTSHVSYVIEHPEAKTGGSDIVIKIPLYDGHPVTVVQDSKHALKTYRNNLYSGARLLVLGNYVAMYGYARDMAFDDSSPLYHRDVEKMDRQDDNAATRLFSATALEFLTKTHPDRIGQAVYLFVFGEVVDAYQNRHITHSERIRMVLRGRFFLDIWRAFLSKAGYSESRYFISREAVDISHILIDGLISLIITHRDYFGDKIYPLLPWLHSSETCEHVFAECRKIVKDFTHLDFLFMVPRLHILIRAAIKFCHSGDPKARAAGYMHSYFDCKGVNLAQLSVFPTDSEIKDIAIEAYEQAKSLFILLGVSPDDFITTTSTANIHLPSVSSWFTPGNPL
jgi:hypothetical protein